MRLNVFALGILIPWLAQAQEARPRARDLGVAPGVFQPGPLNAITDVAGVRIGQTTIIEGDSVRTGITAILQHADNPYFERVPAALHVGNGFGKLRAIAVASCEKPLMRTSTSRSWLAAASVL